MTPFRRSRGLEEALARALEDLEGGLTPLQVLDRCPEYEADLLLLLETAYNLRTACWPAMSMAARVSGRERMHAAMLRERHRCVAATAPVWRQLGAGVALALLFGTTYLASPVGPFRRGDSVRGSFIAPVVATAKPALPLVAPLPSQTQTALATITATLTRRPSPPAEPTDWAEREILLAHTPVASPSPTRKATSTRTRTAQATETRTAASSKMTSATVLPVEQMPGSGPATSAPAPAATAAPAPSATATAAPPVKPPPARTRHPKETPPPAKETEPAGTFSENCGAGPPQSLQKRDPEKGVAPGQELREKVTKGEQKWAGGPNGRWPEQ